MTKTILRGDESSDQIRRDAMGWSGAYRIFDCVASEVLSDKPINKKKLLRKLIDELESGDWDTQKDSKFWEHPLIQEIMREKHPRWFENQ